MRDSSFKHVLKHVETENHLRRVPSRKKTYLILEQFATQTQCSINFKEAKLKKKRIVACQTFILPTDAKMIIISLIKTTWPSLGQMIEKTTCLILRIKQLLSVIKSQLF